MLMIETSFFSFFCVLPHGLPRFFGAPLLVKEGSGCFLFAPGLFGNVFASKREERAAVRFNWASLIAEEAVEEVVEEEEEEVSPV